MNQPVPEVKRILEINPDHPVIEKMNQIFETDKKDSRVTDFSELLHNQALLTEGVAVKDPVRFSKLISDLMIG